MRLKKLNRGEKLITTSTEADGTEEGEADEANLKHHHPPNPSLDGALQALKPVVCAWMDTTIKAWGDVIKVTGLTVARTTKGTRSVSIQYDALLSMQGDDGKTAYSTPSIRIEAAEEGEQEKPVAKPGHLALIETAILEAEAYAGGAWQPGRLDGKAEDPEAKSREKTVPMFPAGEAAGA